MGFRFRKRVSLGSLVRLNFSKSGVSLGLGPRGANVNISQRGITRTVGLPGSGLSHQSFTSWQDAAPPQPPAPSAPRGKTNFIRFVLICLVLAGIYQVIARPSPPAAPPAAPTSSATRENPPTVELVEPPNRPLTTAEIQEVQTLLKRFGRDPGSSDGIVGPKTTQAVKLFEAARGWPITGNVDLRLLEYLRSPRATVVPPPQPSTVPPDAPRTIDASADDTALVLRVLRDTAHPCPILVRAVRVSDGSLRALCTNGEIYRLAQARGEWLAIRCSAAERMGVKGC
ncbi:DUF4236 domain-containing protein [Reyranella sp.]|uniref:DUF4236 domain-containing protein n=1 Tax=Reyranella sp. TaxID=1929291 RepID=UPI003D131719